MNCRGLGEQSKRRDVMQYIRQLNYSIIFLQDTHMTTRAIPFFNSLWKGKCYHSCHSSRSRGTCILVNNNISYSVISQISSECGNYVILICKIFADVYAFVNIYGPNDDEPNFFLGLFSHIKDIEIDHIVVAGDFNFIIDHNKDSLNYVREHNKKAKRAFLGLTDKYNLIDIWRRSNPSQRSYTWTRVNPLKCGRLDMFFVSEHLANVIKNTNIVPGCKTDHNAITLVMKTKEETKGNGIWMFNISHLLREDYIESVKSCIRDTIKQYAVPVYQEQMFSDPCMYNIIQLTIDDCLFYETLIMMLRGESVKLSKRYARQNRLEEEILKGEVDRAQKQFNSTSLENDLKHLEEVKSKLEEIRKPKIDGLIVRSRVQWHEQGEKSSKYFLSLEKRNCNVKNIQYIKKGDTIITQTNTILEEFSNNLERKYSSMNEAIESDGIVSKNISATIKPKDKIRLNSELTLQELTEAMNGMKKR